MNAIQFLITEHEQVRNLMNKIDQHSHEENIKKKLFHDLSQELLRHESMEHQVWYPHFKNNEKIDETVKHLLSEEKKAEQALQSFDQIQTKDEWNAKFAKLKKDVEHHAAEEEEKLFPKVKQILSDTKLEEIGQEMEEFKESHHSKS